MDRRLGLFIAVALYVLCVRAEAQEISRFAGTAATNYMLDGQPAASGAWSLRRLLTSYSTNKLIRIRRASDDVELDIGFDPTGALDIATASTHCAATTCFVRTWYDQVSAGAGNLVQATKANQPAFIFNCLGASPCVRTSNATTSTMTTAANVTPATGVVSINVVGNRSTGTGGCALFKENLSSGNRVAPIVSQQKWLWTGGGSTLLLADAMDAAWHAGTFVINGASSVANVDSVETTGSTTGNTTAGQAGIVGAASTNCDSVAAVFWDNIAISATTRAMLNNNQHAWWGF